MEVTRPDKAHYYTQAGGSPCAVTVTGEWLEKPPAPWRLPTPAELTHVCNALQKAGLADYGNYWYQSNKMRIGSSSGKGGGGGSYNVTFVRLKDGAAAESDRGSLLAPYNVDLDSEDGTAMGRVIYVRSFDPSKPPAKVAAGKPVAPPLPVIVIPPYSGPYAVGGKGPNGGIVYRIGLLDTTYYITEAMSVPYSDIARYASNGWSGSLRDLYNNKDFYDNLLKTGKMDVGDGWYNGGYYYLNVKTGVEIKGTQVGGKWIVTNPDTGEPFDPSASRFLLDKTTKVDAYNQ
ncbi:MAG: hypothetical protein MdMp014T_1256 [Treponematales bacterium]